MIHAIIDFLRTLTDPERLIQFLTNFVTGWLGYALLFGIVFSETGLLVGFFLPGDSLLFTVGVVAGAGNLNIVLVNLVLMAGGHDRGQHRVPDRPQDRPAHLQPPQFALIQTRASHADSRVL